MDDARQWFEGWAQRGDVVDGAGAMNGEADGGGAADSGVVGGAPGGGVLDEAAESGAAGGGEVDGTGGCGGAAHLGGRGRDDVLSDLADGFEYDDDGCSVIESDEVPGGWEALDVTANRRRTVGPDRDPGRALRGVVGTMLAQWRMDRGLGQRAAAYELGVPQARLSRLERGRAGVDLDLLVRLAGITGCDVALTIQSEGRRAPVRRLVGHGSRGRATMEVVIDGPESRRPARRTPAGRGSRRA